MKEEGHSSTKKKTSKPFFWTCAALNHPCGVYSSGDPFFKQDCQRSSRFAKKEHQKMEYPTALLNRFKRCSMKKKLAQQRKERSIRNCCMPQEGRKKQSPTGRKVGNPRRYR